MSKLFFDMGDQQTGRGPLWEFERSKGPTSGYFTTAPASLPCAPPVCRHREVRQQRYSHSTDINVMCRECGKTWKFDERDVAMNHGRLPRLD